MVDGNAHARKGLRPAGEAGPIASQGSPRRDEGRALDHEIPLLIHIVTGAFCVRVAGATARPPAIAGAPAGGRP